MSTRDYLQGLSQLGQVKDGEERRGLWRQSMATLANVVGSQTPVPLEGLDPQSLAKSVRVAFDTGLIDDLSFLSEPAAAAAVYELAAALPIGNERRELGRRILRLLRTGNAATFVALATQLALSSPRAIGGPPMRARVALALDMPLGLGSRADGLALALISRRDVQRDWLIGPSTGSLPSRRLAARMLERAAREAARRASQGDDSGLRVFRLDTVNAAWKRLLSDRESLVWRHVASARGLLSSAVPAYAHEIEGALDPNLGVTEWRRAAASIAASIAIDPEGATATASAILKSELMESDGGIGAAMLLGLPRAAETEPEAAEALIRSLLKHSRLDAIEALVALRQERIAGGFADWAADVAQTRLRKFLREGDPDDGRVALVESLHAELSTMDDSRGSLPDRIAGAIRTFAHVGAEAAYLEATELLEVAVGTMGTLFLSKDDDAVGRRHSFRALRELDMALLAKARLTDLLMLGTREKQQNHLQEVFEQLTDFLLRREGTPLTSAAAIEHPTLRLRRLQTLLHLVDADSGFDERNEGREWRIRTASALLRRVEHDAPSALRRVVCAAAARACDALVREEICSVSDVVLAVVQSVPYLPDVTTFAEATMVPEIETVLRDYVELGSRVRRANQDGIGEQSWLETLQQLANDLPVGSSPRVEALRSSLLDLTRTCAAIASATSLRALAEGTDGTLLAPLQNAVQSLAQLVDSARRRFGDERPFEAPAAGASIRLLDFCLERALRGDRSSLLDALTGVEDALRTELPVMIAEATLIELRRATTLPIDAPAGTPDFVPSSQTAPLPAWLPPGRVLGGFYVQRSLGSGAVGSVFIARRSEDRHNSGAERFALKVPEYDGAAARALSEEQFLELFRSEAGALLSLPVHRNIARFVTFDAGARPKPILVMELVEGPTLERVIEMGDMNMTRAFEILEGIAAGLAAMHQAEIGHLDLKPSNVILRDPDGLAGPEIPEEPVLVDFGLAGRHLRPGCGTTEYGAPEVWRSVDQKARYSPMPTDVYAFGCLTYEVLTGQTLFEGTTELATITSHVSHDGMPDPVRSLAADARFAPLSEYLFHTLRGAPDARSTMDQAWGELHALRDHYRDERWPLDVSPA